MAGPKKTRGFTLVELLVVITIIGMLVSLLLPAIQSAREAGRKNTCANNMRQGVLALSNFENNKRGFPGYANIIGAGTGNQRIVSWVVPILPYLERNDIYQNWHNTTGVIGSAGYPLSNYVTQLAVLVCPSNPSPATGNNPLSFVVNTGSAQTASDNCPTKYPVDLTKPWHKENWAEDGNSGVFFDQAQVDYSLPSKKVTMDFIGTNDGTSYTLMMSENLNSGNWATDPSDATGATVFLTDFAVRQSAGFAWFVTGNNNNLTPPSASFDGNVNALAINALAKTVTGLPTGPYVAATTTAPTGLAFARPSSNHPGGVNAFFCDGHMRFIAEDIGYNVYTQLMTPFHKATIVEYPGGAGSAGVTTNAASGSVGQPWTYTLNEADY